LSHTPDIVIHAAAYKHVPLCEANIPAALHNNIQGSRNVIDCSIAHNVPKIVIISTDKAVRPTNVMGTTKRIVELYAQNVDPKNSEIVAVRFGNVLGSSGSVIPKFKAQIEAGGPLTLTHPDITRYFMLIDEACQLVLQAAAIARGGELFILDMGEPIKIIDLARTMIKLYAKEPIEIQMTGLRAGEKLYEELLIDESEQKTRFESIMIAHSSAYPIDQLNRDIDILLSDHNPIALLKQIVPEFTPGE
jgi:UDP-N-acetyl-D-glucosamine 4,6-dehydratase